MLSVRSLCAASISSFCARSFSVLAFSCRRRRTSRLASRQRLWESRVLITTTQLSRVPPLAMMSAGASALCWPRNQAFANREATATTRDQPSGQKAIMLAPTNSTA